MVTTVETVIFVPKRDSSTKVITQKNAELKQTTKSAHLVIFVCNANKKETLRNKHFLGCHGTQEVAVTTNYQTNSALKNDLRVIHDTKR